MKTIVFGIIMTGAILAQSPAPPAPPEPPEADEWFLAQAAPPPQAAPAPVATPAPVAAPAPPHEARAAARVAARADWSDGRYRRATRALDDRRYDDAVQAFDQVIAAKEPRADGALYWRAFALNKLGRRNDALSSLDQLEKEYSGSAWLNDAKALRLEVQQSSGQAVSPEAQGDDDLKLLAINSLMNTDPERAMPLLDKVLRDPKSAPKVKERALFVLSQNRTPKSREMLINIAKGGGNPDLQMRAIEFLGISGAQGEIAQLYTPNASQQVKEAVINSLMLSRNVDKLAEIARSESNPRLKTAAIERLGIIRSDKTAEILGSLYAGDAATKRAVVNGLFIQRNAKQLVELARKESDPKMKKEIVEHLANMKDKEATDYMLELLK
jgi:tetratricopeptide (TPR) repeat protein